MNIKLLWDRVLIEPQAVETKTTSGLIVSKEQEPGDVRTGTVVCVGRGKRGENGVFQPLAVNVGDKVMFQYGANILVEGKNYSLVNEADIIIVL